MADGRVGDYIIGRALIRRPPLQKVLYREEVDSAFRFEELFSDERIGCTASADYPLSGCFFSFSYEPSTGGRPSRGSRRPNTLPVRSDRLEQHKTLIHGKYRDYLASYEECQLSKVEEMGAGASAKVLLWGDTNSVTEMRESILLVLEHSGISCETLWDIHERLAAVESLADSVEKTMPAAAQDKAFRKTVQDMLSRGAQQGAQLLLSFEAELKIVEEKLRADGNFLRFLFFAPRTEYQKIKDGCGFLPQQIKSVLCVASIGYGDKPELQFIGDKRLEETHEMPKEFMPIVQEIIHFVEQDRDIDLLGVIQMWKKMQQLRYMLTKENEINQGILRENDVPEKDSPTPNRTDERGMRQ